MNENKGYDMPTKNLKHATTQQSPAQAECTLMH